MFALSSPNGTYDNIFLANYSYININDQMTRIKGIASVSVFGAGQYAMRIWVRPDQLAKLNITIPEIMNAVKAQNTVNPAGQVGSQPVPKGQEFTYTVRAQGRLQSEEQFGNIVLRANPDGSIVRVKDVARIELGAQNYKLEGRLNGKPCALIALYQMPGTNALEAANGAKKLMEELKKSFPPDLDYTVALDTTLAVTEGMQGDQADLLRGPAPRHPGRLHLPPGMAGHTHPAPGGAGIAGGNLRALPHARLLHQYPLPLRDGTCHRPGRR